MKAALIAIMVFSALYLYPQGYGSASKYPAEEPTILLRALGDSEDTIAPGDYAFLQIAIHTSRDSCIFKGVMNFEVREEPGNAGFSSIVEGLHSGDSVTVIVKDPGNFNFSGHEQIPLVTRNLDLIRMEIKITQAKAKEEWITQRQWLEILSKDLFQKELDDINNYLLQNNLSVSPEPNGIYMEIVKNGQGPGILPGRTVQIRYSGKFLNGKVFDSSFSGEKGMNLKYGTQFYLVEGLNYAVGRMKEGDKAWVLIPSGLAFGESGSAGGIVPPNTPVIYDLEIVSVK